ncbi:hypothetical protein B0H11DRAFT_1932324 [Mycena galericulata]|nr:hypothetical protein B0H11DRAFT_1932324 [Mycena galericulata]
MSTHTNAARWLQIVTSPNSRHWVAQLLQHGAHVIQVHPDVRFYTSVFLSNQPARQLRARNSLLRHDAHYLGLRSPARRWLWSASARRASPPSSPPSHATGKYTTTFVEEAPCPWPDTAAYRFENGFMISPKETKSAAEGKEVAQPFCARRSFRAARARRTDDTEAELVVADSTETTSETLSEVNAGESWGAQLLQSRWTFAYPKSESNESSPMFPSLSDKVEDRRWCRRSTAWSSACRHANPPPGLHLRGTFELGDELDDGPQPRSYSGHDSLVGKTFVMFWR